MFKESSQGNLRLLCSSQIGIDYDWQSEVRRLRSYVNSEPKLDLYNNEIHLYMTELPWDLELSDADTYCGVLVQGHINLDSDEELELIDLHRSEIFSLERPEPLEQLNKENLDHLFLNAKKYFENQKIDLAETWRIKIHEGIETCGLFDIQFYANI